MHYLRTLGALELPDESGRAPRRLLARPKRFALLVRLAFAPLPRAIRREVLINDFWPEHDQERGRLALRQAVHVLRRELGDGVIVSTGDDALSVDPSALWCDAVAFDEAVRRGDLEAGLELYRGDFLPGFVLYQSPEFDRWVEQTRGELRSAAAAAARSLAETAGLTGSLDKACAWARRSLELAPTDEAAVRLLMRLLDRAGDSIGAWHAYARYTHHLATEYDLEPTAETRELALSIRSRAARTDGAALHEDKLASVSAESVDAPSVSASPIAAQDFAGTTELRTWRARQSRSRTIRVLVALSFVFVILGARFMRTRFVSLAHSSPISSDRVAVFPFDVHGGSEHAYLRTGMVDLLSTKLNGAGGLSAVNAAFLLASGEARDSALDIDRAATVAARFGAGAFIRGSVTLSGNRLQVQASLFRGTEHPRLVTEVSVQGEPRDLFHLLDQLAAQLLANGAPAADREMMREAALSTRSLSALKAYLTGEAEMRAGRWPEALKQFERAVLEDSTFALAEYRLAYAAVWNGDKALFRPAVVERALRHADHLPQRDRTLIRAFYAWRRGDAATAEEMYRSVVRQYPDDVEAWHELGETLFHYNATRGYPTTSAREAFDRVLVLDPNNQSALWHLAEIAGLERNLPLLDSLAARIRSAGWNDYTRRQIQVIRACVSGDARAMAAAMDSVSLREDLAVDDFAHHCATVGRNVSFADRMFQYAIARQQSDLARTRIRVMAAYTSLARGRVRAARAHLDTLGFSDPHQALVEKMWFAVAPLVQADPAELRALRDSAERIAPPRPAPLEYAGNRYYAIGLVSAALGDERSARTNADALERLPNTDDAENGSRFAAQSVRAHALRQQGKPAAALAALDAEPSHRWYGAAGNNYFWGARERYLRAELLTQLGRDREALRWYESLGDLTAFDFPFVAPSHLRRAQIYERLGDTRRATEQYARFIELWQDADPELQPVVADARLRLRRFGG